MGAEHDLQTEILRRLGSERRYTEQRKRKRKDGTATEYQVEVGDGLFVGGDSVWWRVNSGFAKSFSGRGIRLAPKGTADIIGVWRGIPIAIEVKQPKGKLSEEQCHWRDLWLRSGGKYAVIRSMEELELFLRSIITWMASGN